MPVVDFEFITVADSWGGVILELLRLPEEAMRGVLWPFGS